MVHRENLFDGDIVAGIITALIVMILFSIYAIISPTKPTTKQIFQPYPDVSPKEIPDAPLGTQKCFTNIHTCSSDPTPGSPRPCAECGNLSGTFSCTKPGGDDNVPVMFNGTLLDNNKEYCLPNADYSFNNKNADVTLNPLTGVWEWVDSQEFCRTLGDLSVGDQCWKPRCKYPELFANPENGCNTFIGCKPGEGGTGASLRLTAAGAQELQKNQLILNSYTADDAIGILFDPINQWSSSPGVFGISDSVVKKVITGDQIVTLTTGSLLSGDEYSKLMNDGPYKQTESKEDYWACACNFDFGKNTESMPGICKAQLDVPWGVCESHADESACQEDPNCVFQRPSTLFRPPNNTKSCEVDFCSRTVSEAHMRTTDLFTPTDDSIIKDPDAPEYPYCVCGDDTSWRVATNKCQTVNNQANTIIPYGRRKGLVGQNPCNVQLPNGNIARGWLTKSTTFGKVVDMADFRDLDFNIQCCDQQMQVGEDIIKDKCNSSDNTTFTRFCVSRSATGKPSASGVCDRGYLQQDNCLIRNEKSSTGFCASTLGPYGHQIPGPSADGGSKVCSSDADCDKICYTEISSGKVFDPNEPDVNTNWKNAHNCRLGMANELGVEAIDICEGKHCHANCYTNDEGGQCVTPYNIPGDSSPAPNCSDETKQIECEKANCRWLRRFGGDCDQVKITPGCNDKSLAEFCSTNENDPTQEDGTCVLQDGKKVCASCNCSATVVSAPQCIGLAPNGKSCENDNDCADPTVTSSTVYGQSYDQQTHFCDIKPGDSKGTCVEYGACVLNFDTKSGINASPASPGSNVCTNGKNHGESCTDQDDCRPCHVCVADGSGDKKCINPAQITTDCSINTTQNDCTNDKSGVCKWENNTCNNLVDPDPFLACIAENDGELYRCNTNKTMALYPDVSWMDLNAAVGEDCYPSEQGGEVCIPKNRIKPPDGKDAFRCRNSQGCQGFRPQEGPLSDSVALTYTNHPKASLLTPINTKGEFVTGADGLSTCSVDSDCPGGACITGLDVENAEKGGVCIPYALPPFRHTGYSSWADNNATTYMEPSFWDGTGLGTWALDITTCGSQSGQKCPGNLAWCWNGGGDANRPQDSKNIKKFGCKDCTHKPGPGVFTKINGLDGTDIKNDPEAMSACVAYYTKAGCWPPSRQNADNQRIPQIVDFIATQDGVKGVQSVTPCLKDGTMLGASVSFRNNSGTTPFWNDQIGENSTWGRKTTAGPANEYNQYSLWEAGGGETGPLCCSDPKRAIPISGQKTFQEGNACIGGSTKIETDKGVTTISDLKVGDYVKTRKGWSKIFYIRDHGFTKIQHLKIVFENGEGFTLTEDHLVYDSDANLKRADELKPGETILGSCEKIISIVEVFDIPLTPCVIEGEIFVGDFLISCWAQNKENAAKMMTLMKMVEKVIDKMDEKELETLSHKMYEKFKGGGKDVSVFKN